MSYCRCVFTAVLLCFSHYIKRKGLAYRFFNARVCHDMMEDLHKNDQVSSRFSDFKGGVNLGLGTFNLVSILYKVFSFCVKNLLSGPL